MLKIMQTIGLEQREIQDLTAKGIWINLVNPSETELNQVATQAGIVPDLLRAALDEEERSHLEIDDGQLLILINVPVAEEEEGEDGSLLYDTIPLGIIVAEHALVTVCLKDNPVLQELFLARPGSFFTFKKTRCVLQILFKTATHYLRFLTQIDRKSSAIENQLHRSMKNKELIELLNLEKSLVYFTTSLRANEIVMEKLLRSQLKTVRVDPDSELTSQILKMYPEDEELLEDVITENKQAIEMAETYSNILSGMMDAFASVISNNLNIVMKFLTSVTIAIALPTMVFSLFGMNVPLPLQNSPHAFATIMGLSLAVSLVSVFLLSKYKML